MKITRTQLKNLIMQEAAKFGKPVPAEDVEAEETEACDLADSLENHVDHTVKEGVNKKQALAEALLTVERDLVKRLRKIRETRQRLTLEIAKSSK